MELDGCSLLPETLVSLGKGKLKIKVCVSLMKNRSAMRAEGCIIISARNILPFHEWCADREGKWNHRNTIMCVNKRAI